MEFLNVLPKELRILVIYHEDLPLVNSFNFHCIPVLPSIVVPKLYKVEWNDRKLIIENCLSNEH